MGETIGEVGSVKASGQTTLELQIDVLGGLDTVAAQLDQVVAFLRPEMTPREDETLEVAARLAASRGRLHARVLSRLGDSPTSAGELPVVAALLHIAPSIGRMGDQCRILVEFAPRLSEQVSAHDDGRVQLALMGQLARSQVIGAKKAFLNRNMNQVDRLVRRDSEIKRAGRRLFERAIAGGHTSAVRESAMMMLIASRCLEAVADEAIEIGEQAASISAGLFKELADALAYG